jgi:rhamnosyltransferase
MNKVLVVLATYNGEKYVKEQIRSILNQKSINLNILVFDDNSSDETVKIIKEFCDSRIQIIINKKNSGSPANNFLGGITLLENRIIDNFEYIALADQDDLWLDSKLIEGIRQLRNNNSSLYASNLTLWDELNNTKNILRKDFEQTEFDYLFEGASAGCTYIMTNQFVVDFKKFVSDVDFSCWKFLSHDWLIYFFARVNGNNVVIDSKSLILYRIHDSNIHGQLNKNSLSSHFKRFNLVIDQWYFIHSLNFSKLLSKESEAFYIYKMYSKNWFTRFWVLMLYNYKLIRSRSKFLKFALISLIPRFKPS